MVVAILSRAFVNIKSITTVRVVVAVISIVLLYSASSIYDQPFGGCAVTGLGTWVQGCSSWPDLRIGLGTVLLFWVLHPRRTSFKYWGFFVVVIVVVIGGPEAIISGMYLFDWPDMYFWQTQGLAMLLGAVLGVALSLALQRWMGVNKSHVSGHAER